MRWAARIGEGGMLGNWRNERIGSWRREYHYRRIGNCCKHSIHPIPFDSERVDSFERKRRKFPRLFSSFALFAFSTFGPDTDFGSRSPDYARRRPDVGDASGLGLEIGLHAA